MLTFAFIESALTQLNKIHFCRYQTWLLIKMYGQITYTWLKPTDAHQNVPVS